ncbi:MAG: FtsX-like permease family protein [Pseudohongiellaceae bacterium]
MIMHYTRMAFKAMTRFKFHTFIGQASLVIGFLCFLAALLVSSYSGSFDRHHPNADNIYNLMIRSIGDSPFPDRFPIVNSPAAKYLRAAFPELENVAKASTSSPTLVTGKGVTLTLDTVYVEEPFFRIFPLPMLAGLNDGDSLPPNSVILTEVGANKLFGTTDVIGEALEIDNRFNVTVAGVSKKLDEPSHLEAGFALFNTELFMPMAIQEAYVRSLRIEGGSDPDADRWGNQNDFVYLEFPEGTAVDVPAFNARLENFALTTLPPDFVEIMNFNLLPVNQLIPTMLAFITGGFSLPDILKVAGFLVLFIGCLNYSSLVIAQLSLRSQEVGVQKILGAKRKSLIVQYSFESLLFVGLALFCSLLIAMCLLFVGSSLGIAGLSIQLLYQTEIWLALLPALLTIVVISGSYPAIRTTFIPVVSMMRPKGSSGYSARMRAAMVGLQFFISGTLMILAVVMFAQNNAMTQQLDAGRADPKIAITVSTDTYDAAPSLLITELERNPAIRSVSQVDILPWSISNSTLSISRSRDPNETTVDLARHYVGYDYTETMSHSLIAGRDFSRERTLDKILSFSEITLNSGPFSALIDEQGARSLGFENATEAIGNSVFRHVGPPATEEELVIELTIIGAITEPKYQFIDFSSFGGVQGNIYMMRPEFAEYLIVKVSQENISEGLSHLENTWRELQPEVPLVREYVDDLFHATYGMFLAISVSIGTLSLFGFFVASIGLLGNATFITNVRQREVGIRKVMGASSIRLFSMLLLDFAKPILVANALAWPLGYVLASGYTSLFAAKITVDFWPFLISFVLSAAIACFAVGSQSWKSARIRPAMVLRYE